MITVCHIKLLSCLVAVYYKAVAIHASRKLDISIYGNRLFPDVGDFLDWKVLASEPFNF